MKYDENTGKPYETNVFRLHSTFGNIELPVFEGRVDGKFYPDFNFLGEEVKVFVPFDGSSLEEIFLTGVVGINLCDNNLKGVNLKEISTTFKKVETCLTQYGYSGVVKLFSQLDGG